MKPFEEILDLALSDLRSGLSSEEILSKWPEHKDELSPLLEAMSNFHSLPKNKIPAPAMQRKYLQIPVKTHLWFTWVNLSRFAAPSMAAILLIAGVATTAYGAVKSLPGQPLFTVKKGVETIELHFASTDAEKAALQVTITKQRLADAQQVFSSPGTTPDQQLAALNELNSQTDATLQVVQSASQTNSAANNTVISNSLQEISKQQQALLQKITQTASTNSTTPDSTQQVAALQQFKQVIAATNEKASLITLKPDPNTITVSGQVTTVTATTITLQGSTFAIASDTTIRDWQGNPAASSTLPSVNDSVTIVGTKNQNTAGQLVAKEILLTSDNSAISASGTPVSASTSPTTKTTASSSTASEKLKKQDAGSDTDQSQDQTPPPASPSQAIGTFIPEDPSPQFQP